jgi:acetolactate synthase-1/2/3 large subunit
LVDITKDVTAPSTKTKFERVEIPPIEPSRNQISADDLEAAVKMIKKSKKPFVFVGGGAVISNAYEELKEFVEKVDAPVADTLMGKGAFDGTDSRYTGMVGMHGTKASNLGITQCDLLIAIGVRFSDRVTGNAKKFARKAKILHIDIDPAEINKNVSAHQWIVGDVKEVLKRLNGMLEQQDHKEWLAQIGELKEKFPLKYRKDILTGPYILEKLYELTEGKAIISTEVGQHQMWAAQFYKYTSPRTFITSGGLGTMGYGLGACIGAKIGRPDQKVINIAGDGCFRMNMNEIATATRYNIPIIEIIFNNRVLGMVRQWQTLFYGKRYSHTNLNDKVDFVKLAEAMGAKAYRISKPEEVEGVLKEALSLNEPVLIDCIIDCDEKVWPMVAPGAPIDEVFSEEDLTDK